MPFLVPKAPVLSGVVNLLRSNAAAVVDSRRGRLGLRLNRLGRGFEIDLIPRLGANCGLNRGIRNDKGIYEEFWQALEAMMKAGTLWSA